MSATIFTRSTISARAPAPACPLSGGLLTGTMIMCQCHGSEFDVTTGAVVSGPAARPLNVYEVRVADGSVRVRA